jgi:hypothetical protein
MQVKILRPISLPDRSVLPGTVLEVDESTAEKWIAAGQAVAVDTANQNGPRVLTEAELARAANRCAQYVRVARQRGLITPATRTAGGIFIYDPAMVEVLRAITIPVLRSGRFYCDSSQKT